MNREQRRKLMKNHKALSNKDIMEKALAITDQIMKNTVNNIQEGQEVKLDYTKIVSGSDYHKLSPDYKHYIETNKDKTLKIKFDERYEHHQIVQLDNGNEISPFRFFLGDLILLKE